MLNERQGNDTETARPAIRAGSQTLDGDGSVPTRCEPSERKVFAAAEVSAAYDAEVKEADPRANLWGVTRAKWFCGPSDGAMFPELTVVVPTL